MKRLSILLVLLLGLPLGGWAQRMNVATNWKVKDALDAKYGASVLTYSAGYHLGLFFIQQTFDTSVGGDKGHYVGLADNDGRILIEPNRYNKLQIGYTDVYNRGYYPFIIAWEERKVSLISMDGHILASGIKGGAYKGPDYNGVEGEQYYLTGGADYDPQTGFTVRGKRIKHNGWIDVNGNYTATQPKTEDGAVTQRLQERYNSVAYNAKDHTYTIHAKDCNISGLADHTGRVIVPPRKEENVYPDYDYNGYAIRYANDYVLVRKYAVRYDNKTKTLEYPMDVVELYDLQGRLLVPSWAGFGQIRVTCLNDMWYFFGNNVGISGHRATNDPDYMGVWSSNGFELVPRLYENIVFENNEGVHYFKCSPQKNQDEKAIYDLNGVMLIAPYYGNPYYYKKWGFRSSEQGTLNIFLTDQSTLDQERSGPLALSIPDAYWERKAAREQQQQTKRAEEERQARAAEAERQRRNEARLQLIATLGNVVATTINNVGQQRTYSNMTATRPQVSGNHHTSTSSGVSAANESDIRHCKLYYGKYEEHARHYIKRITEENAWLKVHKESSDYIAYRQHLQSRSSAQQSLMRILGELSNYRERAARLGGNIPKGTVEIQAEQAVR